MVSKTREDLPDPDTPVKNVIFLLGIVRETFFRLFSRAPLISMYSCVTFSSRHTTADRRPPARCARRRATRGRSESGALRRSKDLHELCLPVAVEPSKVRDPLDGLLLGVHLDDGETGYQLLPLKKGAVGDRDLALGKEDPGLLAIEPAAGDEDSLFDRLLHELPELGRVQRLLP